MEETKTEHGRICFPGKHLFPAGQEYIPGPGTYLLRDTIVANLAGELKLTKNTQTNAITVTVESPTTPSILPRTGDIVTARVTVVNPRQVHCTILCVGPSLLARSYRGILKKEEIRAMEKDKIDPYKCFRPGDVILARVLPMQEFHWYPLSTAENDLGVVIATAEGSPQGVTMIPTSWSEMQCPRTLVKEPRKVAKIMPESMVLKLLPEKISSAAADMEIKNEVVGGD